LELIEVGILGS